MTHGKRVELSAAYSMITSTPSRARASRGGELLSDRFVRNVNHVLCNGTQYGLLFGGVALASRGQV
jgi:hypothetical protein